MNYKTGKKFPDGTDIMLGDKIQGDYSQEVVVLWDNERQEYVVEVVDNPDAWLILDEYIFSCSNSLRKTGSRLKRGN